MAAVLGRLQVVGLHQLSAVPSVSPVAATLSLQQLPAFSQFGPCHVGFNPPCRPSSPLLPGAEQSKMKMVAQVAGAFAGAALQAVLGG